MSGFENITIAPEFELEEFMGFSHESRLANDALMHLLQLWEEWRHKLQAVKIKNDNKSWLAIWLPEDVEQFVDASWEKSPGEGFLLNSLAQYLCMAAIEELIPQAASGGCAPAPKPCAELATALEELGLAGQDQANLTRRYAVLTYYPFKGGCEICALQERCPKAGGADAGFASVVLPGHEPGE